MRRCEITLVSVVGLQLMLTGCGGGNGGGGTSTQTYTIGGTASGLASGTKVLLMDNGTDDRGGRLIHVFKVSTQREYLPGHDSGRTWNATVLGYKWQWNGFCRRHKRRGLVFHSIPTGVVQFRQLAGRQDSIECSHIRQRRKLIRHNQLGWRLWLRYGLRANS
jgi:hypothetical protein